MGLGSIFLTTNKLIVCITPRVGHGLHQFGAKASLEAFYLLFLRIDEPWGTSGQIVEGMHVLGKGLGPLCESRELGYFHTHQPWGNVTSPKG